ncbi:MAG: fibrinogen-like YCDxxxxGGGW domain-containing protein [Candidatus Absconditabacteria bacterium]
MINFKKYKYGFTLVELVIAVAIILVLVTVAFLTLSKWIGNSRDSRRIGDIATLEKSLELGFTTNPSGMFPLPDNSIQVVSELDGKLWIQGYFGDGVKSDLDNIDKIPVDPSGSKYEYSVTSNRQQYQVMAMLENGDKVATIVNNTYGAKGGKSYIKGFYEGYLIIKNPNQTYTLISSPTLFVKNDIIRQSLDSGVYKSKLIDEIVDNNKPIKESATVLTGDITSFFNREEDTQTMQMIEDNFPGLLQDGLLNDLIISAGGNVSTLVVKSSCISGEYLGFQFGRLKNLEYSIVTKNTDIPNGIIQESVKGTCNNGNYVYSSVQSEKICFDTHVLYNDNCVLDICDGDVPLHGEQNGTQKVGNIRDYDLNPGICKYKCVDGFHLENGICVDDIKIADCGGIQVDNSINNSSGSVTYNKIWNGTYYDPMYLDWDYSLEPGECKFICNTENINLGERYYWDGNSCELLGSPIVNLISNTDSQISINWDDVPNADSYAVKNGLGNRNVIGSLTGYIFEGLTPGSSNDIKVIAIKNYNGITIHSNFDGQLQVTTDCSSGFHFEGEQCVTNNCSSTTKSIGTNQYVLPSFNDGNIFTGSSQPVSIDNGTIIYSQIFQCNLGIVVEVGLQSYQNPICNSGYSPSLDSCIMNTYSISGNFGSNGSGALVSICGFETVTDSSGIFAISSIPEGTLCNNASVTKENYSCTVSTNGPSSIVSNITNVSGSCDFARIWTGDAISGFVFSEGGVIKYPKSCNDLLISNSPNFKIGSTSPWNGNLFEDGVYYIKPDSSNEYRVYCLMTIDSGGWTVIANNNNSDTEPSGCYAKIASTSNLICGDGYSLNQDFAIKAWGLDFTDLVWATYITDLSNVTAYTYGSISSGYTIPNSMLFNVGFTTNNKTMPERSSLNKIICNSSYPMISVGNTNSLGYSYGTGLVTVISGKTNIAGYNFSFTDASTKLLGFDDFQDGNGCSDKWTPKSVAGNSSLIMIR